MKDNQLFDGFKVIYKKHDLLSQEDLTKIVKLKMQYWLHSEESHLNWINQNITSTDYHLWLENEKGEMIAYINHVMLNIEKDNLLEKMIGLGNLCVDMNYRNKEIGLLIFKISEYYFSQHGLNGILLCKSHLFKYYKKAGWLKFEGEVNIVNSKFEHLLMSTVKFKSKSLKINRNF